MPSAITGWSISISCYRTFRKIISVRNTSVKVQWHHLIYRGLSFVRLPMCTIGNSPIKYDTIQNINAYQTSSKTWPVQNKMHLITCQILDNKPCASTQVRRWDNCDQSWKRPKALMANYPCAQQVVQRPELTRTIHATQPRHHPKPWPVENSECPVTCQAAGDKCFGFAQVYHWENFAHYDGVCYAQQVLT